jgi:PEGA domain.
MKNLFLVSAVIIFVIAAGCTATAPATTGKTTLQFTTSPSGAEVYLDNQYSGTTPCSLSDVSVGTHSLEYRLSGYSPWKSTITVPAGTSSYYASLTPLASKTGTTVPSGIATTVQPISVVVQQPAVTITESTDTLVIGGKLLFSGTCKGSNSVILMLYGPGAYTNGVKVAEPAVGTDNSWSYTWNPGTSIMNGEYTMIAYDKQKLASDKVSFNAVGGGSITIGVASATIPQGNTAGFSGLCTSGAKTVRLTLYGPGQYSNGVDVATLPLNADNTWNYKFTFDQAKPMGIYTMYVHDAQNTGSASVIVSVVSP